VPYLSLAWAHTWLHDDKVPTVKLRTHGPIRDAESSGSGAGEGDSAQGGGWTSIFGGSRVRGNGTAPPTEPRQREARTLWRRQSAGAAPAGGRGASGAVGSALRTCAAALRFPGGGRRSASGSSPRGQRQPLGGRPTTTVLEIAGASHTSLTSDPGTLTVRPLSLERDIVGRYLCPIPRNFVFLSVAGRPFHLPYVVCTCLAFVLPKLVLAHVLKLMDQDLCLAPVDNDSSSSSSRSSGERSPPSPATPPLPPPAIAAVAAGAVDAAGGGKGSALVPAARAPSTVGGTLAVARIRLRAALARALSPLALPGHALAALWARVAAAVQRIMLRRAQEQACACFGN